MGGSYSQYLDMNWDYFELFTGLFTGSRTAEKVTLHLVRYFVIACARPVREYPNYIH